MLSTSMKKTFGLPIRKNGSPAATFTEREPCFFGFLDGVWFDQGKQVFEYWVFCETLRGILSKDGEMGLIS
ncbi:hypothetical protein ACWKW1_10635 [Brevibacillus parabrevis]